MKLILSTEYEETEKYIDALNNNITDENYSSGKWSV